MISSLIVKVGGFNTWKHSTLEREHGHYDHLFIV